MSPAQILRLRLRCDRTAPRLARQALEELAEVRPVHDDALLVASELATDAVLSSGEAGPDEIELVAELVPDGLRIAVMNPSPDRPDDGERTEVPGSSGPTSRIVRAIARRWGTDRTNGEQMWAVLAI
jgi:hypothetical protein